MYMELIQEALVAAGYDPGPVDGIDGPLTRAAIAAFQADRGLEVDGMVGPLTHAALFRGDEPAPVALVSRKPGTMPDTNCLSSRLRANAVT